jgi:glycosyltransferase involved in cell wall biosynthesis
MNAAKLSVYIIAYNEADKIKEAIKTVLWADEIIVADSYSTDNTAKIATELGAKVVQIPFNGFGNLRNEALQACSYEWIFSLDSDERCTAEAKQEILEIINKQDSADAYLMPRKNLFLGRWIKHIWRYPDYRQPQLFRKGKMEYLPDQVHEGFKMLSSVPVAHLKNPIWQIPYRNIEEMVRKANRYSSLAAEKLAAKGVKPGIAKAFGHAFWNFFRHYIVKAGFLDGWPGFLIALSHFDGTLYRYAKLIELTKAEKQLHGENSAQS